MSDGTTGIQVAPIPTESEMASIRQIFTNVANALVRASELATQVTDLEGRLNKLDHDYTSVMARNDELVTSLNEVRLQRDDAQRELSEIKNENTKLSSDLSFAHDESARSSKQIEKLNAENNTITRQYLDEIDVAEGHRKRAEDAEAKLKAIHQTLGIPDPKPEPLAPQAEPIPQPSPTEVGEQVALTYPNDAGPARPLTEPEIAAANTWDPNKF